MIQQNCAETLKGTPTEVNGLQDTALQLAGTALASAVVANGENYGAKAKVTFGFADFSAAALTKDLIVATLPAKSRLLSVVADVTQAFAGPAGTLALTFGKTAGGAEFLASFDVKSATVTKGLADADMGTLLTRAAAIQGGTVSSWSATTDAQCRVTSSSGNLSTLSAGSVTFYLTYELLA